MASLFKKIKATHLGALAITAVFAVAFFLHTDYMHRVQAETALITPLEIGDASGFAWMGTGIANPAVSQGGGGWLNFNCKASYCIDRNHNNVLDPTEDWGVTLDLNHAGTDGVFLGQAWSSNYGWLSFRPGDVSGCWSDNPGITSNAVARAAIESGTGIIDVTGWGKFVAGDDSDDGWDGCVAFSGANHSVTLDMQTGKLAGWAWGGPVVGWVSFSNPECHECNTSVMLGNAPSLSFWADDYLVPSGGGTTLHWQGTTSTTGNYVNVCPEYSNTSNYGHWKKPYTLLQSANVSSISFSDGNLPVGQHAISNITADTTYEIHCQDRFGVDLPPQYVTIEIEVPGCMDPAFPNYNPNANVNDGSCGNAAVPTITLNVITNGSPNNTLPEGSTNPVDYQVSPRWVFTNRNQFAPAYCTQSFKDENSVTQNLNAWTGAQLSIPPNVGNNPFDTTGNSWVTTTNIAMYASDAPAGSFLTFRIECTDLTGTVRFAEDTVEIVPAISDPVPTLALFAENPTIIIDSGNYDEKLWWTSNNPSALNPCSGSFQRISPNPDPTVSLAGWTPPSTSSVPSPNMSQNPGYTNHQTAFNTLAAGVTIENTVYRFTITCDDTLHPGEEVSASTNVQFVNDTVIGEPPLLSFWLMNPDADGDLQKEQIPATGYDVPGDQFTLEWQALNVHGCKAASEQFNGSNPAVVGEHSQWAWPDPVQDDGNPMNSSEISKSFPIVAPLETKNTIFYLLDCIPDDPAYILDPANPELPALHVCMSITGQTFPQCSTTGQGQVPSYIEI